MSQSALQLERYFFSKISIEASKQIQNLSQIGAETRVETARNHSDQNRYLLSLTVTLTPPQNAPASYRGEVQVLGFFLVQPDVPRDKQEKLVSVTGASILYGAAREMIANVTARGPWPAVTLPWLNFSRPGTSPTEEVPGSEPAPALKQR